VATPIDFGGFTQTPGHVPGLGEHTDEVLRGL
jgi:hypothetical protein